MANEKIKKLIIECAKNQKFKEEFKKNPKKILEEKCGIKLPENLEIKVVENKENTKYLIIPHLSESGELSDHELQAVAAGFGELGAYVGVANLPRGPQPEGGDPKRGGIKYGHSGDPG